MDLDFLRPLGWLLDSLLRVLLLLFLLKPQLLRLVFPQTIINNRKLLLLAHQLKTRTAITSHQGHYLGITHLSHPSLAPKRPRQLLMGDYPMKISLNLL